MNKAIKTINIVLTAVSWRIFVLSLIRLGIAWRSLPEPLGIHFAEDGEFDVFDSKSWAMYPYIVTLAALVFFEISALLSKKIKLGLNIAEEGDLRIRSALRLLLGSFKPGFSFFFAGVWADFVIRQRPLNTAVPAAVMVIMFALFVIFVIAAIVIKIKNPRKEL